MKNLYLVRFILSSLFVLILGTCVRAQTCDLGTNDWEGSSNANPPAGWTRGGDSPNISSNVFGEQDGVAVGFNTIGEFVSSPALACVGEVSFEWHSSGQNSTFTVEVQWSQTPDDEASWQTFGTFSAADGGGPAQTQYMSLTADLPEELATAPFNISVRWVLVDREDGTAYIDNICFTSGTCVVQPSQVVFTDVPSSCIQVGAPFTVEVCATDDNGFVAETFTDGLMVTSTGSMSGGGTMSATAGCATFVLTTGAAGDFDLTASAAGLSSGAVRLGAEELCPREETVRVITYNVLNFPNGRAVCEDGDIVQLNRQDTLAKIMNYLNPDVLMVCELQTQAGSDAIIGALQGLNPDFRAAAFLENQSSSVKDLNNMLYYNSAKMTLVAQSVIETGTRDISRYRMRMNDPQIATATDTVFVDYFVAHLKAGGAAGDRQRRADDVAVFQTRFEAIQPKNAVLGGDMNFYESSEVAYQTLLTSTVAPWFDPVMAPGDWDNDPSFGDLHTQSARAFGTQSYDCGITGGIDSRFDFLLINDGIEGETDFVEYLDGSYEIPGNNGGLFNQSINDPSNNSGVPFDVLNAMFFMSDHLPVQMDLKVSYPVQVLPVELVSFSAEVTDEKTVVLNWTARNASGFSHYEVERLAVAGRWERLGRVNGGVGEYGFRDWSPEAGANSYRLRLVDLDGSTGFSEVETVNVGAGLRIYPTVTDGMVRIEGVNVSSVRVTDLYGRERNFAVSGEGRIDLAGLRSGWCVVQVLVEGSWEGERVLVR